MMYDNHSASCDNDNPRKRKHCMADRSFDANDHAGRRVETQRDGHPWTFVSCALDRNNGERTAHNDAIVIAVDGACRDNGRYNARGGYGVYFHDDNDEYNEIGLLPDDVAQTNQRAELTAGLVALRIANRIKQRNYGGRFVGKRRFGPLQCLNHIVIKADSEYLVKGMTTWIDKWRNNGFLNARGVPVTNQDLFECLDEEISDLNDMDVQVDFWHVRRAENAEADCLANAALDGVTARKALDRLRGYDSSEDDYSSSDDYY